VDFPRKIYLVYTFSFSTRSWLTQYFLGLIFIPMNKTPLSHKQLFSNAAFDYLIPCGVEKNNLDSGCNLAFRAL
jgi:hypothetical protein